MELHTLIKKCQKKELKAQKTIYEMFSSKIFSVCLKYAKNYTEAQDVLQDSFISIFENIHQFKNKGSFEGWMKRIAINTALSRYRNQKVFPLYYEQDLKASENNYTDYGISLQELLRCVQELPNRYRMVFNLYVLDGYSHKEISQMMHISEGTSKSNLARSRKILQQKVTSIIHKKQHIYNIQSL